MKAARILRQMQQPQSLLAYVRQFLTPQVWKQARQAVPQGCFILRLGLTGFPMTLAVGRGSGAWRPRRSGSPAGGTRK